MATFTYVHGGHTEGVDDRSEQAGDGGPSSVAQTGGGRGGGGGSYQVSGSTRKQERLDVAAKAAEQHEEWRYLFSIY